MELQSVSAQISAILAKQNVYGILAAVAILIVGFYLARRVSIAISKIGQLGQQQKLLLQKATYYGFIGLVIAAALNQMGFDLNVILGAAGVLTVAVGFAAQTSASNLISGLFLIVDRPFQVGDIIEVNGNRGEVLSVDLLSCKVRTFDNILIRIPNETMLKSDIKNMSFFPIRRIDIKISVSYSTDIAKVRDVLMKVATRNPAVLEDPPTLFIFLGFGESGMDVQFSVWTLRDNILMTQNSIHHEIKDAFDRNGIEIPFPHRQIIMTSSEAMAKPEKMPLERTERTRLQKSWVFKGDDGI